MNRLTKSLAVLALLSISHQSLSKANIDVMIVFSDDISMTAFDKSQVAASYQSALAAVYGDPSIQFSGQLDGDFGIEVWPLLTPAMNYTAGNKTGTEALEWLKAENADQASDLRIARELAGNPGPT